MKKLQVKDLVKKAEQRYNKKGYNKYRPFKPELKAYTKLNIFKNKSVSFDPNKIEALSYHWWVFVAKIKGKLVFNEYPYTASTSKHQYQVKRLLNQLNIKIDLTIESPEGLQNLESSIKYYDFKKTQLLELINKPKSRFKTNEERICKMYEYNDLIDKIRELL